MIIYDLHTGAKMIYHEHRSAHVIIGEVVKENC